MCIIHRGDRLRKFYYLVNHELRSLYRFTLCVCILLVALQQFFLLRSMEDYMNRFERFEDLLSKSGAIVIFLVSFAVLSVLCVRNVYSNYMDSKSIYTLLTLPQKREYLYFAKIIAFTASFLALFAAQVASACLGYRVIAWYLAGKQFPEGVSLPIRNGLFLAFVRSEFLRLILPLGLKSIVSNAAVFMSFVCSLYYAALCERAARYAGFAAVLLNIGLIVYVLNYRITALTIIGGAYRDMYLFSGFMLCVTLFIVYDSIRLIKRSAIV